MIGPRASLLLAAWLSLLVLPTSAHAAPLPFDATLKTVLAYQYSVVVTGSGTGTSAGAGGSASISAGVFAVATTGPLSVSSQALIDGFGVGAPGQVGQLPLAPGTNRALSWNGVTGTMGIDASLYLIAGLMGATPANVAGIPLAIVGVGGTQKFLALSGLVMGSVKANPYQLGRVTIYSISTDGFPSPTVATGFDNRTQNGKGVLQLVSPTFVTIGGLATLAGFATLTVDFYVPEPATLGLVGLGLAVLGAMRRRNAPR
jgi:hypothetical protein